MYTQIILGRGMALKISNIVNDYVKKFGTTKIYSKLSKGDQVRFKTLGWREDEFNRIEEILNSPSTFVGDKISFYGNNQLNQWSGDIVLVNGTKTLVNVENPYDY